MDGVRQLSIRVQHIPWRCHQRPYTKLNSALVTALSFTDKTAQASHTYFYVVTAVDTNGSESAFSNTATAIVPSP